MEHTLKQIKDNWIILLFIVSLITTWTTFNSRLIEAEGDINKLQTIVESINEIKTNIAVMQNDISYIKAKIK